MDLPSDQDLIFAIQKGDVLSYEILVKRYQQRVFSFIKRMVGTDEVAEDITQEVLFRVYTVIDRIDPTKKFTTFLFEIAKNKSIDYIRARKSTSSIEEMEIADNSLPLEEILFEEEKKKTLQQAIHQLPEHYRTVILLYYFDELSYEEIAKQLNLPINTVRTRLKRAKEQLKHTIIL